MASSGRGGSPAPGAAVLDNLVDVCERAVMLQAVLQGSSPSASVDAGELMEGMITSLSDALSALDASGGEVAPPSVESRGSGAGKRKRPGAVAGPHRRSSSPRRRSKSPYFKTVTSTTLDDGNSWRKYGQKNIQESTNSRSYYRCTHKPEQGCMATRQVQESENNPSDFIIKYFGQHTCRDLSKIPLIVEGASAAPPDCAKLISFASSAAAIGGAASTSAGGRPYRSAAGEVIDPIFCCFEGYSSSPAVQECTSGSAPTSNLQMPGAPAFENMAGARLIAAAAAAASTSAGGRPCHSAAGEPNNPIFCCFEGYSSTPVVQECASGSAPTTSLQTPVAPAFENLAGARLIAVAAAASTSAGGRPYHSDAAAPNNPIFCCFEGYSSPTVQECTSESAPTSSLQTPGAPAFEKLTGARLIAAAAAASTSVGGRPYQSAAGELIDPISFCCFEGYSSTPVQECASGSAPTSSLQTTGAPAFEKLTGASRAAAAGKTAAAFTVGSAPAENWPAAVVVSAGDMTVGGGMGSFFSSPSRLGFMPASPFLGSFSVGDDDDDDLLVFDSWRLSG